MSKVARNYSWQLT